LCIVGADLAILNAITANPAVRIVKIAIFALDLNRMIACFALKCPRFITSNCAISKFALACSAFHQPIIENVTSIVASDIFVEQTAISGALRAHTSMIFILYWEKLRAVLLI
jgi:hypothetical protein